MVMRSLFGYEKKQLLRAAYVAGVIGAVYLGFRYLLPLVWPFVLAYLVAGLLRPAAAFLTERVKMPPGISSIMTAIVFFLLLGTGGYYLGKLGIRQLGALLSNLESYLELAEGKFCGICEQADRMFSLEQGTVLRTVEKCMKQVGDGLGSNMLGNLSGHGAKMVGWLGRVLTFLLVFFIGTVLILRDMLCGKSKQDCEACEDGRLCAGRIAARLSRVREQLTQAGLAYLKTQAILLLIIGAICSAGFLLLGNRYALVAGMGVGLLDAFPALGSGMILIPWAVVKLLSGEYRYGGGLLVIYALCQITRELLEPKLLGNRIGIRPIYTLLSMYLGLKLFGVIGFLLGPLGLVLILALTQQNPF